MTPMLGGNRAKHNARFYDSLDYAVYPFLILFQHHLLAIVNAAIGNFMMLTQMEESGYPELVLNQAIFWNLVRM